MAEEKETTVKVGLKQVTNPTPKGLTLWIRVFTVTAAFFMGFFATNTMMGPVTKNYLNTILGFVTGLINVIAPLFGISLKDDNQTTSKPDNEQ